MAIMEHAYYASFGYQVGDGDGEYHISMVFGWNYSWIGD